MTNRIFVDSSVSIEAYQEDKSDFYQFLFSNKNNQFYLNENVISEYLYYIPGFNIGVSPRALQQKNQIEFRFESEAERVNILEEFHSFQAITILFSKCHGLCQIITSFQRCNYSCDL